MNGATKTVLVFAFSLNAVLVLLLVGETMAGDTQSNGLMGYGKMSSVRWM